MRLQSGHHFAAPGAPGEPEAIEIKIDNFSFMPQDMTVAAGTTVTWLNRDDIPHNVRSTDDLFRSKALDTDDKFSFKFDKAGTYTILLLDSSEDDGKDHRQVAGQSEIHMDVAASVGSGVSKKK